ncbi:murein hydrolase activator EnvC family protein [Rhizobium sp. C4]|uniref:murein hydrolase activator EnvC family protein n=1 Tax=Rhizobium sp. C4 TaxID=1349800 RepID=UPI001E352A3B|nr:murein hydrolase activator EnvC [Rhizobium sp. C4]MCD2175903.1 murein hydrolase activator EnvC [Rhizobium sp. C4]
MTRRTITNEKTARRGLWPLALLPVLVLAPVAVHRSDAQDATTAPKQNRPAADAAASATSADPSADLAARREATRQELEALSKTISLSDERVETLKKGIADLKQNTAGIRDALVVSATRRKELETRISEGEKSLSKLRTEETVAKASLHERRGLLAEVLAALQRMGRNPPPALLVTPEDALSSVRSAILLGAVVPGIRHETDKLVADLSKLAETQKKIGDERTSLATLMTSNLEEQRRMNLLIAENEKNAAKTEQQLAEERAKSEDLAKKAANLQDLIGSLEDQIGSVRDAAAAAKAQTNAGAAPGQLPPDKNRIAPAYAFAKLTGKLVLPAAGDVVRNFGDPDGTGHVALGTTLATAPGAVVTAPADGWVVYAGPFRSYGQMVILNPGDGYHVVMSGMGRVSVRPGQFVVAGEPLAVMGEKRVASAAALTLVTDRPSIYIEFRQNGKPVDSRPWWTAPQIGKARNDT